MVGGALLAGWALPRFPQVATWAPPYRFQLNPPETGQFDVGRGFAISPDGRTLAFVAKAPGKSGLWLRPIDGTARLLTDTQEPGDPFWSSDGRSIAYQWRDQLWRVDVAEGSRSAICDLRYGYLGGTWLPDDVIVYSEQTGLRRVAASGGASVQLTKPDAGRGETAHRWPQALPGGRILFQVEGNPERAGIYVLSLAKP